MIGVLQGGSAFLHGGLQGVDFVHHSMGVGQQDLPDDAVPAVQDQALVDSLSEGFGLDGLLGEAVRSLSEEERELFRDVWIEGFSYAELSRRYGSSEGAVRTRVSRLKKKITGFLRSFLWPFGAAVLFRSIFHLFSGWV